MAKSKRHVPMVHGMIDEGIQRLGDHFIGLWCIRGLTTKGKLKPRTFAVTVNFDGHHFDTDPQPTAIAALNEAHKRLLVLEDKGVQPVKA